MDFGNLQRRWQEAEPQVYDKETRIVCLDIKPEQRTEQDGDGEPVVKDGYSFIPVEIDTQIDYGHIKSQLIEAGFAQKDEFGLLMNAVDGILSALLVATSWNTLKSALGTEHINKFADFCDFRRMCAEAAETVMQSY